MLNRKNIIAIELFLVFFFLIFLSSFDWSGYMIDYSNADYQFYIKTGSLGLGHDLTIIISRGLTLIDFRLIPLFFYTFFIISAYLVLREYREIKYPALIFLIGVLIFYDYVPSIMAQIFSMSFFNLMFVFYFKGKYNLVYIISLLMMLAHFWFAFFGFFIFIIYMAISKKLNETKYVLILSALSLGIYGILNLHLVDYLIVDYISAWGLPKYIQVMSKNYLWLCIIPLGLILSYLKNKKIFKLSFVLSSIPLLSALVFSKYSQWSWRLFLVELIPIMILIIFIIDFYLQKIFLRNG